MGPLVPDPNQWAVSLPSAAWRAHPESQEAGRQADRQAGRFYGINIGAAVVKTGSWDGRLEKE